MQALGVSTQHPAISSAGALPCSGRSRILSRIFWCGLSAKRLLLRHSERGV